jgi:AraC-like DNA-binding protein
MHRDRTTRARHRLCEQAQAIIERDAHHGGLSLARVADELAVSPRHLQRVYREVGQTTFRAQVYAARMGRALELLREEHPGHPVPVRSVREVAAMVGYNQPAGFAKAFRRYWGAPPHQMRDLGV